MAEESPVLKTEIHGVLTLHPWIGQVSADHDLDEDLFSLAVKRAGAYGWSTTLRDAQNMLGGQRWEHADAGGDWSQDGQERQVAWLTVYPAAGLRGQHLPVLPMVRTLTDALHRVGRLRFTELRVHAPVALARDAGFDLRAAADWFALASPDARTDITVTVGAEQEVSAEQLCAAVTRSGHGLLRLHPSPGDGPGTVLAGSAPEWTPDAAAWTTGTVLEVLRADGVRAPARITVRGG